MATTAPTSHRDALLEAAKSLLRERDYGNITARELVAASGTNLGSIGYHFGSKEGLLNEAIGQAFEDWAEEFEEALRDEPDATAPQQVARSWQAALDDFDRMRPYVRAFHEALPRSAHSRELAERLAAHYERQRQRTTALLVDAFGDRLEPGDARNFATLLIAIMDGLTIQSSIDRDAMPSAAELAASTGRAMAAAAARA